MLKPDRTETYSQRLEGAQAEAEEKQKQKQEEENQNAITITDPSCW